MSIFLAKERKNCVNSVSIRLRCQNINKTADVRCKVTLRGPVATIAAVEKSISTTYSGCVFVALGIQCAMRMRHTVISGLPASIHYFYTSHKRDQPRGLVVRASDY